MGQQKMNRRCCRVSAEPQRFLKLEQHLMGMQDTVPTRKSKTGFAKSAKSVSPSLRSCLTIIKGDAQSSSKFATRISFCKTFYQSRFLSLSRQPQTKGASSSMQGWVMMQCLTARWARKGTLKSSTSATSLSMWPNYANTCFFACRETCKLAILIGLKKKGYSSKRQIRILIWWALWIQMTYRRDLQSSAGWM